MTLVCWRYRKFLKVWVAHWIVVWLVILNYEKSKYKEVLLKTFIFLNGQPKLGQFWLYIILIYLPCRFVKNIKIHWIIWLFQKNKNIETKVLRQKQWIKWAIHISFYEKFQEKTTINRIKAPWVAKDSVAWWFKFVFRVSALRR